MKSSPFVRLSMAAGIYLMLMWGYLVLPSGQWFAAYLAVMMSIMLLFWVNETTLDIMAKQSKEDSPQESLVDEHPEITRQSERHDVTLEASVLRLDSLKSELNAQYAQFGQDQSLINSKSLGSWHGTRNPRT